MTVCVLLGSPKLKKHPGVCLPIAPFPRDLPAEKGAPHDVTECCFG